MRLFGGDALSQQHRAHDIHYAPLMPPAKEPNHALFSRRNRSLAWESVPKPFNFVFRHEPPSGLTFSRNPRRPTLAVSYGSCARIRDCNVLFGGPALGFLLYGAKSNLSVSMQ
jgi:hypothetical protein